MVALQRLQCLLRFRPRLPSHLPRRPRLVHRRRLPGRPRARHLRPASVRTPAATHRTVTVTMVDRVPSMPSARLDRIARTAASARICHRRHRRRSRHHHRRRHGRHLAGRRRHLGLLPQLRACASTPAQVIFPTVTVMMVARERSSTSANLAPTAAIAGCVGPMRCHLRSRCLLSHRRPWGRRPRHRLRACALRIAASLQTMTATTEAQAPNMGYALTALTAMTAGRARGRQYRRPHACHPHACRRRRLRRRLA